MTQESTTNQEQILGQLRDCLTDQEDPEDLRIERVEEIIRYLFSQESYISENKIHRFTYLSEVFLAEEEVESGIHFTPFIDGIRVDEVDIVLSRIESIESEQVLIRGDHITVYRWDDPDDRLGGERRAVIESVYEEYSDYQSQDLLDAARETQPFRDASLLETVQIG